MNNIVACNFSGDNLYYHSILYVIDVGFSTGEIVSRDKNHSSRFIFHKRAIPYDKEIVIIDGCNLKSSIKYIRGRSNKKSHGIIIITPQVIANIIQGCINLNERNVHWLDISCTKEELINALWESASEKNIKKLATLTPSELKTTRYLLRGYKNRNIAILLNKNEKNNMLHKEKCDA